MGMYSVKSAYNALQNDREDHSSSDNSGFWRTIWNLKIPKKNKVFIWRAVRDCLPTKEQLQMRKVAINPFCPVCNAEHETIFHCLVTCPFAVKCWEHKKYDANWQSYEDFKQWLADVIQKYRKEDVARICMICWNLWKNINDIVWNQRSMESQEVVKSAELVLNQWRSAQDRSFDNYLGFMTQADGKEHWERPPEGMIKINTDGALFEDSNTYSFSMIARNHSGELVEANPYCRQGSVNPEMAEALGIREALSWLKRKGGTGAVVETDCFAMVQAIRSPSVTLSYLGRVVKDCKSLLVSLKERNVTLNFVKRSANNVAHYIARNSSYLAERSWKGGDAHPNFHHVMLDDLKF